MPTIFPEDKEKLFAYMTIHDFFDIYVLDDALRYLHTILKAAGSSRIWKKGYPFSALHYMQQLEKLSNAAFYINEYYARREGTCIKKDKRPENPPIELLQTCFGRRIGENLWTCFPATLRRNSFTTPTSQ